jgi:hypothetical protein
VIIFPDSFDDKLGNDLKIEILSGLKGFIQFEILNRKILIHGFQSYLISDGPIGIKINNVVNPNKPEYGDCGVISLAVLDEYEMSYIGF